MIAASAAALLLLASAEPTLPVEASGPSGVEPLVLVQTDLVAYTGNSNAASAGDPVEDEGFRLRRARLGGRAVGPWWRGKLVLEAFADGDAGQALAGVPAQPRVTEAYVGWRRGKAVNVDAGVLRVPFSLSRQTDEGDLRLPERPFHVQQIAPDFRAGAAVSGDLGHFLYAAGVYNASPSLDARFDTGGILYAGRLAGEPLGPVGVAPWLRPSSDRWWGWWRFAVGLAGFYESQLGRDNYGLGGDAQFQWRRLAVTGEILWTRHAPQRLGFHLEPGWFVIKDRLELTARFEWYDRYLQVRDPADSFAFTGGLTFLPAGGHIRLQAAYAHRRERTADQLSDDWAIIRATLAL